VTRKLSIDASSVFRKPSGELDGEAVLSARWSGARFVDLAVVVGSTPTAVQLAARRAAARLGLRMPRVPRSALPTAEGREQALDLRARGLSWQQIARQLRCSVALARNGAMAEARRRRVDVPKGPSRGGRRTVDGAEAYRLRWEALTWGEIAARLGATRIETVWRAARAHAKERGFVMPSMQPNRREPKVDGAQAYALFVEEQLSWLEIGKRLRCTGFAARLAAEREAERHRLPLPPRRRKTWIDIKRVQELRVQGWQWAEIAKQLQCSESGLITAMQRVKSLFLCECLTREHRAPVVHAAAA